MKIFRSTLLRFSTTFVTVSLLFFSPMTIAANDDEYDDGGASFGGGQSAEEKATSAYNKGLKQLNSAWKYAQETKTLADDKKREKLLKKSHKLFLRSTKSFKRAIKHNPEMYQAYSSLGFAFRNTGSLDESLLAYEKALSLKPDYYPAIEYLAETHLQLRQFPKVQSAYSRLSEEQPKYANKLRQAIVEWKQSLSASFDSDPEFKSFDQWFSSVTPPA